MELTTQIHLVLKLRMCAVIVPLTHLYGMVLCEVQDSLHSMVLS